MITSNQVIQQLTHLGANPMACMVLDSKFAIADQTSMVDFWKRYYDALQVLGLLDYDDEDWDCDDYAIFAWAFMRMAFRRTCRKEGKTPSAGINLGLFAFERAQSKHMLNFQPTTEGILFAEPQPQEGKCGKPVHMTNEEILSCFAYAI